MAVGGTGLTVVVVVVGRCVGLTVAAGSTAQRGSLWDE